MMLIRSDSGHLMLVSQQALAQAQQGTRSISGQAQRILTSQVCVCVSGCAEVEQCSDILFGFLGSKITVMSEIQVSAAAGNKSNEKVTVIRMTAPPSFQPASVQKTAVVNVLL